MLIPITASSLTAVVDATARAVASTLVLGQNYLFGSSTACYIRQGTAKLLTCVTKANLVDGETITIGVGGAGGLKVYEFDVAGNGVTAGRVQVNVSADTTAAQVAARLRTAILANQATLEVTDNADGTLTTVAPDAVMIAIDTVANVGFTIVNATMTVTAASGSMYLPINSGLLEMNGDNGPQLAVIRETADGRCSITRGRRV